LHLSMKDYWIIGVAVYLLNLIRLFRSLVYIKRGADIKTGEKPTFGDYFNALRASLISAGVIIPAWPMVILYYIIKLIDSSFTLPETKEVKK
jgi:hypothetical protein